MSDTIEVVETSELSRIVQEQGLAASLAQPLIEAYGPFFTSAQMLIAEAGQIVVTDATQVTQIKAARAARLKLKDIRVEVEAKRKQLKEDSLRTGKAIDNVAGMVRKMIEPEEARLEECEKFAERAEAARVKVLIETRTARLAPFGVDPAHYALGTMTEEAFDSLVKMHTREREEKAAAELKAKAEAEAARLEREAEEARIRAENMRLQAEAEAARKEQARIDAEAAKERARVEAEHRKEQDRLAAVARAEREAREKAEREAREVVEAAKRAEAARVAREQAEAKAKAAAEAKAKRAPDGQKLKAFAASIRAVALPEASTEEGKTAARRATNMVNDLARAIEDLASQL